LAQLAQLLLDFTGVEMLAALRAARAITMTAKPIEPAQFVGQLQSAWK
jgi:hypothetical protein